MINPNTEPDIWSAIGDSHGKTSRKSLRVLRLSEVDSKRLLGYVLSMEEAHIA